MIDKIILTKRVKLFNIKLKNKKRQNSALNIFRSHRTNLFKDNQEYTGFKTSMAKNTIIFIAYIIKYNINYKKN